MNKMPNLLGLIGFFISPVSGLTYSHPATTTPSSKFLPPIKAPCLASKTPSSTLIILLDKMIRPFLRSYTSFK